MSRSDTQQLTVYAIAVVGAAAAWHWAPTSTTGREAAMAPYFPAEATVAGALLVAAALFQGALGVVVAFRVLKWAAPATFVFLGVATAAGLVGSLTSLENGAYRWLFALSAGPLLAGLVSVVAMGWVNVSQQSTRAAAVRAAELDPDDALLGHLVLLGQKLDALGEKLDSLGGE
ncbi:MAG TPA: hypothetical protein VK778_14085 [Solirubrobacteraceae bacterium]|nr:hypothetical protein [Solirubrobacteraceae bacterium]